MSGWMSIYRNMVNALQTHTQAISRFQEQVSSGSRINRPSDDPNGAWRVMNLQDQVLGLDSFGKNLQTVTSNMEQSSTVLQEMSDQLIQAKQLLTQAATGTGGATERITIGQQINSILDQIVSLANSKSSSGYLFSGSDSQSAAYSVARVDGEITQVTYGGSRQSTSVPVAAGVEDLSTLVGPDMFAASDRQTSLFLGNTGAQVGQGTSSVTGTLWMTVRHVQTQYDDPAATGITAGDGSAALDTVIGTHHYVTIDGDAKTIKLDDGPVVSYASGGTDLQLTNAAGDKVYVDVSAIDASLAGQVRVNLTATAKLSIDDAASSVTVTDFPTNVAVTNSKTGQVLYVDATNLAHAGAEPVMVPGSFDLFQSLIEARDLLLNRRGLSTGAQSSLLVKAANAMDDVIQGTTEHLAAVGSRLQAMDSLKTTLDNRRDGANLESNSVQEADIALLAADLAREQTLYQMALATSAKMLNLSLLDYIK